jgi:signal transduction histidine kinase
VQLELGSQGVAPGSTVDTSAFRIVQEALTNTLKHASASRAKVTVRCDDSVLHIEVVDDGTAEPTAAHAQPGGGLGLIGMRERAVLHGGQLAAAHRPGGGFAVHAQLPIQGSPA